MMRPANANLLLAAAVMFALAGCASKKPAGSEGAAIEERGGASSATADTGASGSSKDDVVARSLGDGADSDAMGDIAGAPSARQVFFDLDQYTVKPEYQGVVQATADFLKSKPKVRIIIQGNTDERGSREYNLSLGQKRSEAVRKALGVLGIGEDRIETVSFGEEKPMAECQNESCWAKNRRADIVYVAR